MYDIQLSQLPFFSLFHSFHLFLSRFSSLSLYLFSFKCKQWQTEKLLSLCMFAIDIFAISNEMDTTHTKFRWLFVWLSSELTVLMIVSELSESANSCKIKQWKEMNPSKHAKKNAAIVSPCTAAATTNNCWWCCSILALRRPVYNCDLYTCDFRNYF